MSATLDDIANKEFDYVLIGGGTAGLTLAARLAERKITIAVLEAGRERLEDSNLLDIDVFAKNIGNPEYDWFFETTPQKYLDGRSIKLSRGRVLGGSSALNFHLWCIPPARDIDEWEKLGNPGWNFDRYQRALQKVVSYTPVPEEVTAANNQIIDRVLLESTGTLPISFPSQVTKTERVLYDTFINAGIKPAKGTVAGDPTGLNMTLSSFEWRTNKRTYAGLSFYAPNAQKPNLRVLCGALVHRITTRASPDRSAVTAEGVEFEYDGRVYSVSARREVILCAGAIKSPQILELSGIGNEEKVLRSLDIPTILNLPGVGANIQEHFCSAVTYELDPNADYDTILGTKYTSNPHTYRDGISSIFRVVASIVAMLPLATVSPASTPDIIRRQRERIAALIAENELAPGVEESFNLMLDRFESTSSESVSAGCEILFFPGIMDATGGRYADNHISFVTVLNHALSRGTIHAISTDPHADPAIDPHYFEEPIDLDIFTEIIKYIREIAKTEPIKSICRKELFPGPDVKTDKDIREFLKETIATTFHTCGSLSMLPCEKNGVVDPNLRVYGTSNIRVCDLSIAPLAVSAHTQSVAYAIGQQAADIILDGVSG